MGDERGEKRWRSNGGGGGEEAQLFFLYHSCTSCITLSPLPPLGNNFLSSSISLSPPTTLPLLSLAPSLFPSAHLASIMFCPPSSYFPIFCHSVLPSFTLSLLPALCLVPRSSPTHYTVITHTPLSSHMIGKVRDKSGRSEARKNKKFCNGSCARCESNTAVLSVLSSETSTRNHCNGSCFYFENCFVILSAVLMHHFRRSLSSHPEGGRWKRKRKLM